MSVCFDSNHITKHTNYSLLWIIILCLNLTAAQAQTQRLDSLKNLLPGLIEFDEKFKIMDDIAWYSRVNFPDQAITYARKIIELGKEEWTATAYNRMGAAENSKRNLNRALDYYDSAYLVEKGINHSFGMGRAKSNKARVYIELMDFDNAKKEANAAIYHLKKANNPNALAIAMGVLGSVYTDLQVYDSSYYYLTKSNELSKSIGFYSEMTKSLINLGRLYIKQDNFQRGIDYNKQAIEYINAKGLNQQLLGQAYTNMGAALFKLWKLDEAEQYQFKALAINTKANNSKWTSINYTNLGNINRAKNQPDKSATYHIKSRDLKRQAGLTDVFIADINLGYLHLDTNKPKMALESFEKALMTVDSIGQLKSYPDILRGLSRSHFVLGNAEAAVKFQDHFIQISKEIELDRIKADNLASELAEQKYITSILQATTNNQTLINENQRLTIFSLIGGVVLIVILFFTITRLSQLRNKHALSKKSEQIQQQQIEQLIKEKEVDAMNAMVEGQENERLRIARDLHDRLGGTLSIVKMHFKSVEESVAALQESNVKQYMEANHLLDEACEEVRKIAHDMTSGVLLKFGLAAALQDLKATVESTGQLEINLIDIGLEDRLTYEYEINIYRMVQELLTNTLKHANASEMNVQVFRKAGELSIVVDDNGVGFDPGSTHSKDGIGLKNVKSRVSKLKGKMNIDSGLGAGTTITIDLPLLK